MDDIVIKAMAKWPNVPAVYGWLSLDRRGRWLLKGAPISNEAAIGFINRNYLVNETGCWYFQNGPQRVFVALEYTPWVYMLDGRQMLHTHSGLPVTNAKRIWLDDAGDLLLLSEHGVGLIHDIDLPFMLEHFADRKGQLLSDDAQEAAINALLQGQATECYFSWQNKLLPLHFTQTEQVAAQFDFNPDPQADTLK